MLIIGITFLVLASIMGGWVFMWEVLPIPPKLARSPMFLLVAMLVALVGIVLLFWVKWYLGLAGIAGGVIGFNLFAAIWYKGYLLFSRRDWVLLTHEAYNCARKGDYQKSIELAERAIKLNPRASEAWRLIGNAYEFLGDEAEQGGDSREVEKYHKKATEAWNRAKEINPKIIIPGYHE